MDGLGKSDREEPVLAGESGMNGFVRASSVEMAGMARLLPFLTEKAYCGRLVRTAKGPLAKEIQASFGDLIMNTDEEIICSIEVKIEQRWTGNLFLETWSNRNLEARESQAERGSKPGWMVSQRADLLLYYFMDSDDLLVVPLFRLKRWAFGYGTTPGRIYQYPERAQGKYNQMNDTWGRCVPVSILEKETKLKRMTVRQLSLTLEPSNG